MNRSVARTGLTRAALVLATIALLLLAFAGFAVAQEETYLDGKIRFGDDLDIGAGETVDSDLYLFGGAANVAGTVNGDLFVFAGSVTVSGTVAGDVVVGAGSVDITGTVEGDLRAGTGQLDINGSIGEDALIGAGAVNIDGPVGEDLIFGSGTMTLDGDVAGDVLGSTGVYNKSGSISGTERVQIQDPDDRERPNPFLRALQRYIAVLLVALLGYWLLREPINKAADLFPEDWLRSLGWGVLVLAGVVLLPIGTLLVGILLAIVFGLFGLGELVGFVVLTIILSWVLVGTALFVLGTFLAPIIIGLAIGRYVVANAPDGFGGWFLRVAVGAVIVVILTALPAVGWLFGLVITASAAGALALLMRKPQPDYLASDEAALGQPPPES